MSLIELLEEGPLKEQRWLQEKAKGLSFATHHIKGTQIYRVDLFDKTNTRVYTLESLQDNDKEGMEWGRSVFISYLLEQGLLPKGGALW